MVEIPVEYKMRPDETEEDFKIRIGDARVRLGWTWQDAADFLNSELGYNYSESKYRKEYNFYLRGREAAEEDRERKFGKTEYSFSDGEKELREKYVSSAENVPYYRLMRQDARFERFYQMIAEQIKKYPAPIPTFCEYMPRDEEVEETEFFMTLADLHIGACFDVVGNSYSVEIAQQRFDKLLGEVSSFVQKKKIRTLSIISLGDVVQGILRISDLKLNEMAVVDAFVTAMRMIASFLNALSAYCNIDFYQVCYSNHDQLRPLGTKASELGAEDMGKILFAYLCDTLAGNSRIKIIGDTEHDYLEFSIFGFNCIALHGHQVANINTISKDLASRHRKFYDYVFLGHTHSAREVIASDGEHHDMEVLTAPSMVGVDPYAQKLMVGSKAAVKIFEFDPTYGHIASYKIILN